MHLIKLSLGRIRNIEIFYKEGSDINIDNDLYERRIYKFEDMMRIMELDEKTVFGYLKTR